MCCSERVSSRKSCFNYLHVVQMSGGASLYEARAKENYLIISKEIVRFQVELYPSPTPPPPPYPPPHTHTHPAGSLNFGSIYHVVLTSHTFHEIQVSSNLLLRANFVNLITVHNKQFAKYVYHNF